MRVTTSSGQPTRPRRNGAPSPRQYPAAPRQYPAAPRQYAAGDSGGKAFRRDAPTLLCYGAVAGYAFWLYAFGPALALLRTELHFSYTLLGVYSALWSAGATLVGVSFAVIARRLHRAALLWYSAAGATAGAVLFAAVHTIGLTLLGAVVLGFAGTTLLTCTQAILSDRHGERRDRALTEANVGAAACAVLAPLLLGLLQGTPAGWRAAMGLPVLVFAGLYLRYRNEPLPAATTGRPAKGQARLPPSCWLLATLVAVGIAVEFCLVYFGAELLTATGLHTARAATAMSSFYVGILGGRVGGVWITRRAGRTVPLLWTSLAVTAAGFLLFWLAGLPALAIAGLFLCGLGVANLYPLSLALTLAAAPGNGDTANARIQLLGGALVVAAPYLLGSLADHFGLHAAFTIVPVLIGVCAVLLPAGLRLASSGSGA
jgi:MFS family permease